MNNLKLIVLGLLSGLFSFGAIEGLPAYKGTIFSTPTVQQKMSFNPGEFVECRKTNYSFGSVSKCNLKNATFDIGADGAGVSQSFQLSDVMFIVYNDSKWVSYNFGGAIATDQPSVITPVRVLLKVGPKEQGPVEGQLTIGNRVTSAWAFVVGE